MKHKFINETDQMNVLANEKQYYMYRNERLLQALDTAIRTLEYYSTRQVPRADEAIRAIESILHRKWI